MGALIGFVFGYVVGAKAGPERLEEIREAWATIATSEEFRGLVATVTGSVQGLMVENGAALIEQVRAVTGGEGELGQTIRNISGNGDLLAAWEAVSQSTDVQKLLASGMAFLSDIVDRSAGVVTRP